MKYAADSISLFHIGHIWQLVKQTDAVCMEQQRPGYRRNISLSFITYIAV